MQQNAGVPERQEACLKMGPSHNRGDEKMPSYLRAGRAGGVGAVASVRWVPHKL